MRHDHVVEEVCDRLLVVVQSAADIQRNVTAIGLEIVGVAVVMRLGRAVQPMPCIAISCNATSDRMIKSMFS